MREAIENFFRESANPVLFAGAGVAAKAGLPTWGIYLSQVAELVRSEDPYIANGMHTFIQEGEFARAVSQFNLSTKIREGDKLKYLATPLRTHNGAALVSLAKLPFRACVTTNFDKAFHDSYAIASKQSALEFNLDDEKSLRAAAYEEQYFIARIHGRVEVPQTMVLAAEDYRDLLNNESYLSLLEHIFTRRQVLFVGFSFLDPAIRHVFRAIEKKIGSAHHGRHVALFTADAKEDFVKSLERHNVKRITYDSSDNHRQLWDAIAAVKVGSEIIERVQVPVSSEPLALARKYLASCYARTTLKGGYAPLRGTIVEGMVVHLIKNAGRTGLARADLDHKLAMELKVTHEDITSTINHALDALVRESICKRISVEGPERYLYCGEGEDDGLDSAIAKLVKSATSRFVVREGGTDTSDVRAVLSAFFRGIVIQRGWDLGAAFAAGRGVEDLNIDRLMWSEGRMLAPKVVEGLIASCNNLFMRPDAESAKALSTLGRASFALELVLQSPRDTLFHSIHARPRRGHPGFVDATRRPDCFRPARDICSGVRERRPGRAVQRLQPSRGHVLRASEPGRSLEPGPARTAARTDFDTRCCIARPRRSDLPRGAPVPGGPAEVVPGLDTRDCLLLHVLPSSPLAGSRRRRGFNPRLRGAARLVGPGAHCRRDTACATASDELPRGAVDRTI